MADAVSQKSKANSLHDESINGLPDLGPADHFQPQQHWDLQQSLLKEMR
jgi:hypothetical protein